MAPVNWKLFPDNGKRFVYKDGIICTMDSRWLQQISSLSSPRRRWLGIWYKVSRDRKTLNSPHGAFRCDTLRFVFEIAFNKLHLLWGDNGVLEFMWDAIKTCGRLVKVGVSKYCVLLAIYDLQYDLTVNVFCLFLQSPEYKDLFRRKRIDSITG